MGIVVLGAVFVDVKGYPLSTYIPGGRNVGRVEQVPGGVSRNVVEDIANVELRPTFVSLVDDTGMGEDVVRQLRNHKVNTDYILRTPDGMGAWLAVFDNHGDVCASISKRPDLRPLAALLEQVVGMPKFQLRRDQAVLYYRESENIEDALTAAGAPKSAMELMEVKIVRDMRNKVNRVTNCETANIDKTVTASARQIADIEYLILSLGLEGLPEELREVAVKRMENPELSLRELLGTLSEPLSRSGLNHRLSRLSRMAEELRTRNAD